MKKPKGSFLYPGTQFSDAQMSNYEMSLQALQDMFDTSHQKKKVKTTHSMKKNPVPNHPNANMGGNYHPYNQFGSWGKPHHSHFGNASSPAFHPAFHPSAGIVPTPIYGLPHAGYAYFHQGYGAYPTGSMPFYPSSRPVR